VVNKEVLAVSVVVMVAITRFFWIYVRWSF
jgi:hypothetical protein